jgi:hypothetical protein
LVGEFNLSSYSPTTFALSHNKSNVAFLQYDEGSYHLYRVSTQCALSQQSCLSEIVFLTTLDLAYHLEWSANDESILFSGVEQNTNQASPFFIGEVSINGEIIEQFLMNGNQPDTYLNQDEILYIDNIQPAICMGVEGDIFIMKADGTHYIPLPNGIKATYPERSPNGEQILFHYCNPNSSSEASESFRVELYAINIDGSNLRFLGEGSNPNWSPNGEEFVFRGEGTNFYIMDIEGNQEPQFLFDNVFFTIWEP